MRVAYRRLAAEELESGAEPFYVVLAGLLWLGLLVQTLTGEWSSDFKFHTAAIAEFSNNPFSPRHIFLPMEIPHHSLSFYHQFWGVFSSISGLSAIAATQVAAMMNATVLLIVFPYFVRVFVGHRRAPAVALLTVLLAWGPGAWRLSSLLNLNSLGFGLPYPSYFAVWLSMLLIVWLESISREKSPLSAPVNLGLAALGFLISNAHLISFGSFMVLAVALALSRRSKIGARAILVVVLGAVVGAIAWPFFPLVGVAEGSSVIDELNFTVYESTLVRLAPSLLGLIPLVVRFRRDRTDPLFIAFVALVAIYLGGLIIERFVFGRVLGVIALILQLALADGILELCNRAGSGRLRWAVGVGMVGVSLLLAYLVTPAVLRMIPRSLLPESVAEDERLESPVEWLRNIDPLLGPGDVVLAPRDISMLFPVTGAKVVTLDPAPFVENQEEREADATRFFTSADSSVLQKYNVTWVAFRDQDVDSPIRSDIRSLGDAIEADGIVLVDLRP